MKKICFAAILLVLCVSFAFTENNVEQGSVSYVNVPILKVYDATDCYVVAYRQNGIGIGQTSIPKSWFIQGSPERKASLRNISAVLSPYLTIWFRDGEFDFLYINITSNRADNVWGVAAGSKNIPDVIDPYVVASGN